jgi:hypothetical protein
LWVFYRNKDLFFAFNNVTLFLSNFIIYFTKLSFLKNLNLYRVLQHVFVHPIYQFQE